jgi:hypothetical protein
MRSLPHIKCYPTIRLESEKIKINLSQNVRYPGQSPEYEAGILSSTGIPHSGKFEINNSGAYY